MGEFDIAIIGMSGRFPGARTLDQFWRNLRKGVASTTFYSERELIESGFDPELVRDPNFVKAYPALEGVEMFDAGFFGYSPKEAETIDPQQRLFLEVAWEALEDAGYDPMTYPGSIGIFGGASAAMYLSRRIAASGGSAAPMDWLQLLVGSDKDYVATRVAYKLNLRGPSLSVQTACSTSLVAVHLACQSLLNNEADMVLAGGVCIRLPQRTGYLYQPEGVLSPDGYCRSFDARGQGTVFGNGVGAVVLKRLEAALEDGDPIHAVIKGSAVNNDGATKIGFLAPSQEGQARAISEALAVAQVEPRTVGYVECHGTATPVGDPIEIRALTEAFGGSATGKGFCAIGSVKANVGHLDSAAGVAGLIRAVLALKHQEIPPLAHFERPNPECDLEHGPFYAPRQTQPWVRGSTPRRAGVSAFAIGGTNAHVVLEEAPERPRTARPSSPDRAAYLLPLSARGTGALPKLSAAYAERLATVEPEQLEAVSYTASVRRAHHPYRVAVVGGSVAELRTRLEAHARGETVRGVVVGAERISKSKVAFVFSGQGSQWVGMGRGLLAAEPAFREDLERCDAAFRPHLGWSVREALHAEDLAERLERTEVLLPLLFSVQVAQVALLRSWGLEPEAVVGHSLGEAMAAHVAGMLTREEAARLVCLRTAAVAGMVGKGGVALVELPREEVPPYLEGYAGRLAVAAENGPKNTLVAGEKEALEELLTRLEQRGIFCRRVRMGFASHSPQMEGPAAELRKKLAGLRPRPGQVRMLSTVTGEWVEGSELTAEYWGRNLREPVRFWSAVKRLAREGYGTLIEVSPHPVLTPVLEEALGTLPTPATIWPTLRRGEDEPGAMLEVLGRLYASGHTVDFQRLYPSGGEVVPLPAYPWQHERFWLEDRVPGQGSASARGGSGHHPLLGEHFEPAEAEKHYFQADIGAADLPYLEDHRIQGAPVMPPAVFAEMAIAAARRALGEGWESVEEVALTQPLTPGAGRRRVQLALTPGPERSRFEVLSRPLEGGAWTRHAHGWLGRGKSRVGGQDLTLEAARARCQREIPVEERYQALAGVGLEYGPAFQGLEKLWLGEGEALGRVRLPEVVKAEASRYRIHPALLESCLQIATVGVEETTGAGWMVSGWRRGRLEGRASGVLQGHAVRRPGREPGAPSEIDLRVWDDAGQLVLEFEGLVLQQARRPLEEALYTLAWIEQEQARSESASRPEKPGRWLLFGERGGKAEEVARRLEALGAQCVWVRAGQEHRVLGPGVYEVDPSRPDAFDTLVRQETGLQGVLHLWSLDVAAGEPTTAESLIDAERLLCLSTLHLVQSLSRLGGARAPRLCLVTRGAQTVAAGDAPVSVAQAPLWGLGRTVRREHPELRCVCVDLGSQAATDEYDALLRTIFQEEREEQLAFRGQRRYVARLVPHALPARTAPLKFLSQEATYLVTGGLGALGQVVARWLVERGARHLVLLGRNPPLEPARAAISELERAGARIRVEQADLARRDEVARVLSLIEADMPPLRGVLHLAGTIEDAPLARMTVEQFRRVTRAKLEGAWNLHALTLEKPLDFFVLFSSLASLLGSPGQANYAAANASLEALAAHRRALGLPAVCLNWGAWKVGMATRFSEAYWRERNLRQIAPEEGMAVLARMGDADVPQLAAPAADWARFLGDADEIPPVFDEIAARFRRAASREARASAGALAEKIREARPGERQELLSSSLRHGVAAVLGFDASKPLERKGFFDLGMDSLSALRFSQRLKAEIGATLPVSVIFRHPTVESLARHILEDVLQIPVEAPAPAPVEDRALDTEVAQMSDLEVQAALAELADSVLGDGDEAE